ncbi:hypothetical protein [Candidatus Regiella endosymbiont of Tuberolachnus salignus]|uniref:hypothetical protein n=1 Tax=Candidatus Regiella endosymbiont of Tuberolachnus salignus TaxID=3077956 RepID=UPI0030CED031
MKKIIPLLFLLTSYFFSSLVTASPAINIGSMYDMLMPGESTLTKRIYNSGSSTAFVRVDILEITLGEKKNTETPIIQVKNNKVNKETLIVTPQRLIIPPSGFQYVRLIFPGKRDKERYYRVRFTPVLPKNNDGFNLTEKELKDYKSTQEIKAGVNVMTGYGSALFVLPENPHFDTQFIKDKQLITVKNNGNATVLLDKIKICLQEKDKKRCEEERRTFILPGKSYQLDKKTAEGEINYTLIEGKST